MGVLNKLNNFTKITTALTLVLGVLSAALLAGCAATTPAPVSDRTPAVKPPPRVVAPKPEPAPAVVAKPDAGVVVTPLPSSDASVYTVKQGDTLFSIAKSNGVALRDLAAWNNIEDPASIRVGQQLRLTSPDGVAVTPAKPLPGGVEGRPIGSAAPTGPIDASPPVIDPNLKTQPQAQRVPYSEQAHAQISKGPQIAKADTKAEIKPDAKPEVKPEVKPEAKPEAPRADGEVNWSWPTEGKVVGNFNESSNKGITIAGKRGQPVHASAGGRVIFSGVGIRGLGKLVVIRHNSNYLSVYAHNDKLLVKEGQNVTKGQRIAEMGNSDADQVKLHFEIRKQGKPIDPIKLLPAT
jgi:lipoprotein NlpD